MSFRPYNIDIIAALSILNSSFVGEFPDKTLESALTVPASNRDLPLEKQQNDYSSQRRYLIVPYPCKYTM